MVVLHHCVSARSFRPLWLLEEIGEPYELLMHTFPPRTHSQGYLETNSLGTVPKMLDKEVKMTESVAICQYLAARHSEANLNVASTESSYADYLNFLHFGEATLTFPQTLVLRYSRFEPPERRQPQIVDDYTRWFLSRLRTLESRLVDKEFICADRFTAADISVGYALLLASHLGLDGHFKPAVASYWKRLQNRDAFQRAQTAENKTAVAQGVPSRPSMSV